MKKPRVLAPVKIAAVMANEFSGDPPQLDGLLIARRCRFEPSCGPHERYDPAPNMKLLPKCALGIAWIRGWLVHRVSSPIVEPVESDRHHRLSQHFPREFAGKLVEKEQGTIATTNGAQKSLYLPVRRRLAKRIVWFAAAYNLRELRRLLESTRYIGKDRAQGHGRVAEWIVEEIDEDLSWFAPHPQGTVLMRQLPVGDWLPQDLTAYRRDYDAVTPPYWHPGRRTEIVRPC